MGSVGTAKKLVWEKKRAVKKRAKSRKRTIAKRFFLKKRSDRLEKASQETS